MKEIHELELPQECRYTDDHEWARTEGDLCVVGIDDYAQDQLGDIVFVDNTRCVGPVCTAAADVPGRDRQLSQRQQRLRLG